MLNVVAVNFSDDGEHLAIVEATERELSRCYTGSTKSRSDSSTITGFSFGCDLVGWEKVLSASLDRGISASEVKVVDSERIPWSLEGSHHNLHT